MKLVNVRTFRANFPSYSEPVTVVRWSEIIGTWIPHGLEPSVQDDRGGADPAPVLRDVRKARPAAAKLSGPAERPVGVPDGVEEK